MASPCWTVFSLRVRRTRIADIASDPHIWGSPRVDDDRNGPGAPILSSFVFLDRTRLTQPATTSSRNCAWYVIMELKITPSGQTIVKPTALGPVANTDSKLLIYGLFQKGRVLAQDGQARPPWRLVTDQLKSYSAAHREVMPPVVHYTDLYGNTRAEVSHEPTR